MRRLLERLFGTGERAARNQRRIVMSLAVAILVALSAYLAQTMTGKHSPLLTNSLLQPDTSRPPHRTAPPRDLRPVPAPGHDPLKVDQRSIKRDGDRVRFAYVLNIPTGATPASGDPPFRSSEVVARIDCAARAYVAFDVIGYTGPDATGMVIGTSSLRREPGALTPISKNDTFDHLARYLCLPPS